MKKSISIIPQIGTIANSIVSEFLDNELKSPDLIGKDSRTEYISEKNSTGFCFQNPKIDVQLIVFRSDTAFFTGDPVEILLIAISGGVATHIITRIIDKITSIIKEKRKKAKKEISSINQEEFKPNVDSISSGFMSLNKNEVARYELHQLTRIQIVVKDNDNGINFKIPEEQKLCIKHFHSKSKDYNEDNK